jgi:hypothetical protein
MSAMFRRKSTNTGEAHDHADAPRSMSITEEFGAASAAVIPHSPRASMLGEQQRVEVNKEKLRFGDIVFFRMIADGAIIGGGASAEEAVIASECNPFLQAEGFSDGRIGMLGDDQDPKKFHYALFRIVSKLSYDASKSVEKLTRRQSTTPEDVRELQEKVAEEQAKNSDLVNRPSGDPVCFGDTVQLQHVHSGKYVALIPRKIAQKEKDNMALELIDDGSEGAWFKFAARWKVSGDGDSVLIGDQVKLSSTKLGGHAIHGGGEMLDRDPLQRFEVNLSTSSTHVAWKLHLYSKWSAQGDGVLNFGEAVRLHHTEAGAFVSGTCNRMRSKPPYLDMAPTGTTADGRVAKNTRAKTVFRVEAIERSRGGTVHFNMSGNDYDEGRVVRFRHVPTGRYLAVNYFSSGLDKAVESQAGGHTALTKISSADLGATPPTGNMYSTVQGGVLYAARLVDSDDRSTHFHLVPVLLNPNPDDERVLYSNAQVRIQHVPHPSTGLPTVWLHDPAVEKEAKSMSSSATNSMGNRVNRWLGFSTQCLDQDSYALKATSSEEVCELAQIAGAIDVLNEYTKLLDAHKALGGSPLTPGETAQVIDALTELIYSALVTANKSGSVLDINGIPCIPRQNQMREMKLIDELFWVLLYPVDAERGGFTMEQLARQKRHSAMLLVHRHVYKCIEAAYMGHRANENYIASHTFKDWRDPSKKSGSKDDLKYLEGIIGQLGYEAGAAGCLTNLLTNNRELLENRVGPETINIFLEIIKHKGPSKKFLAFLSSVASCNGKQVISKQELLLKMCYSVTDTPEWLGNRRQLMMETIVDPGSALRPWVSKSDEDAKEAGKKVDHGHFLGQSLYDEGTRTILVGWSCAPGWGLGSDDLYYQPSDIGLTPATPPNVSDELAHYLGRSATMSKRYQWARLEDFVWTLRPERLCESMTGKTWESYQIELEAKPAEKDKFDKLQQLAAYYHCNLELYAEMCLGRSYNCIEQLKKQFSYELLVSCIANTKFPPRIRQSFCDLCIRLWVDRFPHEPMKVPNLARIYTDIETLDINASDALPQYRLLKGNPLLESKDPFDAFPDANKFHLMEDIISDFIDLQGGRSIMENTKDNYLTLSLLECCQLLARFGFYSTTEEIADLVDPLISLLDGRLDAMTVAEAEEQDARMALQQRSNKRTSSRASFWNTHKKAQAAKEVEMQPVRQHAHFSELIEEDESKSNAALTVSGRADVAEQVATQNMMVDEESGPARWDFNDETQLVMNSKCEMLAVVGALSDVRLDFRLSQLLAVAKNATKKGGVGSLVYSFMGDEDATPAESDIRRLFRKKHDAENETFLGALRSAHTVVPDSTSTSGDPGFCVTSAGFNKFNSMFGPEYAGLDMDQISESPLVTICFDLMMYESASVFEAAFRTLFRHFSQRASLLKCLKEVQLLVNEKTVSAFQMLERELSLLRNRFESYETWGVANDFGPVQDDVVASVKQTLVKLEGLCKDQATGEPVRETQNLLRALRVSDVIAKALQIPIPPGSEPGHLHDIKKLCNKFFSAFVCDNKKNQARAHRYLDTFLAMMGKGLGAPRAITSIFSHNPGLCNKCSMELIDAFVGSIRAKSPPKGIQFLGFLDSVIETLVPSGGQTLKDKQSILLKQLTANNNAAVLLLFNECAADGLTSFDDIRVQPGYQERVRVMKIFDPVYGWRLVESGTSITLRGGTDAGGHTDADIETYTQQAIYHSMLLEFLGKLCAGKSAATEMKCQTMLPLEHVLCVILDPETVAPVRTAMVRFLNEVYFETEISDFKSMELHDGVWEVIARFATDLMHYAEGAPARLRTQAEKAKAAALTADDAANNFSTAYIFNAVLPTVATFAENFCFKGGVEIAEDDPHLATFDLIKKGAKAVVACGDGTEKQRSIAISTGVSLRMYSEELAGRLDLSSNRLAPADVMSTGRIGDLTSRAPEDVMANYANALEQSKDVAEACSMEFLNFVDAFFNVEKLTDPMDDDYLGMKSEKGVGKDMRTFAITLDMLIRRTAQHVRTNIVEGDTALNMGALRVLREIVEMQRPFEEDEIEDMNKTEDEVKEAEEAYIAMQNKMCDCGAIEIIIDICSEPEADDLLVIAALELAIQLLVGGNLYVQSAMYTYLTENKVNLFFESLERRIMRARMAVKKKRKKKKAEGRASRKDVLAFDDDDDFDYVRMDLVGEFLQLCCEGHNLQMQNLLRDQASVVNEAGVPFGFVKSQNLINVTADLVVYMAKDDLKVRDMDEDDAEDISKSIDFLVEACQGPCQHNQELLARSGMVDACMRIISQRLRGGIDADLAKDTKAKAVKALASLLEGRSDNIVHKVLVKRLDPPVILQRRLVKIHKDFMRIKASGIEKDKDWDEEYLDEGFDLLTMSKALGREDDKFHAMITPVAILTLKGEDSYRDKAEYEAAKAKHVAREDYREAFEFFTARVRSVEIHWNDQLERIFFPLSSECEFLNDSIKDWAKAQLDFSSDDRVRDFLALADQITDETQHLEALNEYMWYKGLGRRLRLFKSISFFLALLMNFIMLVSLVKVNTPGGGIAFEYHPPVMRTYQEILGSIQVLTSSAVLCFLLINRGPLVHKKLMRIKRNADSSIDLGAMLSPAEIAKMTQKRILELKQAFMPWFSGAAALCVFYMLLWAAHPSMSVSYLFGLLAFSGVIWGLKGFRQYWSDPNIARLAFPVSFVYNVGYDVLLNPNTFFYVLYVLFAVLGLTWQQPFYCFHLLDLVVISPSLQNVVRSVTQPITSLAMTALLGLFAVYIFSLVGFYAFPNDFYSESTAGDECKTMVLCFTTFLYNGLLSGGGIADFMSYELGWSPSFSGLDFQQTGLMFARTIFDLMFFIIVLVLLLNIIFGIILDTFSDLREKAKEQNEDMTSKCFICGIDKTKFDEAFQKRGIQKGFELEHIDHEHNMWDYLSFVMHLNHKEETDYTGAETYVANCLSEEDISWVPQGCAMELVLKEEDDDVVEAITQGTESTLDRFKSMAAFAEANFKKLHTKVAELEERNNSAQSSSSAQLTALQGQMATLLAMKKK